MDTFYFSSSVAHYDNNETMQVYLENHLPDVFNIIFEDGTYAEIQNRYTNQIFEVHASGNGDSFNHKIEFNFKQ